MNISDVAKKIGLSSKTIRFYEQKGLISAPARGDNGYRCYNQSHLEELSLLCQARQVGFSLEECRELIHLFHNKIRHSVEVKRHMLAKATEIEQQIQVLQEMRQRLVSLASSCPGNTEPDCPIINQLTAGYHSAKE